MQKIPPPKNGERSRSAYGVVRINDWLCGDAHNALRFLADFSDFIQQANLC
jgi:hypothetical protein